MNKKFLVKVLLVITVLSMIFITGCGEKATEVNKNIKCTVKITCENLLVDQDKVKKEIVDIVPEDGIVLKETEVMVSEGTTLFEATKQICKDNKIPFIYEGDGETAYVQGIYNIFEKDAGKTSGWICQVNNKDLQKSAGAIEVKEGDSIHWGYVKAYGDKI